ncbi:RNA polymerase subunit AC19 [Tieghemiomyces parasiticus]|uniref:DNA-directed RNA polymerases I and III subunit RPAC2 n=1 Tax=Tieghemiomyces parasiticus TaxID=78921 RepID=A0A9W7ZGZ9_9FUNG|nr:RNA polymerase subunit AC19 [Tieghemiomyces parasiticus]KAJ1913073.1 RNA polymerase subunit AC19 [Tieghemiomyces parasiticus]
MAEQTQDQLPKTTADGIELASSKVEILAGSGTDPTAATFVLHEEDHTLANPLRHAIMQNPEVEFCGYSIPHPSEYKVQLRIQTTQETTALAALKKGLEDVYAMCDHTFKEYHRVMKAGEYEIVDEE